MGEGAPDLARTDGCDVGAHYCRALPRSRRWTRDRVFRTSIWHERSCVCRIEGVAVGIRLGIRSFRLRLLR